MMWSKIRNMFQVANSSNYALAKEKLSKVRTNISDAMVVFQDVTVAELVFLKDKWISMPLSTGGLVKMIGVDLNKELKTILCVFEENTKVSNHAHVNSYEMIYVVNGEVILNIDGEVFILNEGDSKVIPNGFQHYINCSKGTSVLNCYASKIEYLIISENCLKEVDNLLKIN